MVKNFMHNVAKWPNILLKSCGVHKLQDLKSMFGHCTTLCIKGLKTKKYGKITSTENSVYKSKLQFYFKFLVDLQTWLVTSKNQVPKIKRNYSETEKTDYFGKVRCIINTLKVCHF